ncbi:MAG: hypothetical protein HY847_00170 [Betaproteobacteria bacterium]|nr:hypothetical protein [Betaproteobacteria bacterium]
MEPITGALWRRRMQELARNAGKPHAPMFAPLLFAVAAQIEALPVPEMVGNATRLRKNLSELRRMLGLPAVFCAAPSLIELEALGVPVNAAVWPPQAVPGATFDPAAASLEPEALLDSPRFAAAVDVVRQFAADSAEPVIAVALTGPATLAAQLRLLNAAGDDETLYEFIGRLLAVLLRLYAEAGANLIQLHESQLPGAAEEYWKGALGTAGNVARFHRIPPVLVYSEDLATPVWPMQAVPAIAGDKPPPRAHAYAWASAPERWQALPGGQKNERVVTTATEVPADFPLAELLGQVKRVLAVAA